MSGVNRVALVTGAHRGIGRATAEALATAGCDIVATDRLRFERLDGLAEAVAGRGRRCVRLVGDLAGDIEAQGAAAKAAFGRIDVVVCNAAVFPFQPLQDMPIEVFRSVLECNLVAPWRLIRALQGELALRRGCAVMIGSCSGCYGGASPGGSAYDASKAALHQLAVSLAHELGPSGIRINAVAPGVIASEAQGGRALADSVHGRREIARTPLRRIGEPAEVAAVVAFLASDAASYVTGTTTIIDGGAMGGW